MILFCIVPPAHSKIQQGHKVLPSHNASGCFDNLVALMATTVGSVVSGDLVVVGFTTGVRLCEVREE